jgi:hypothetical protein
LHVQEAVFIDTRINAYPHLAQRRRSARRLCPTRVRERMHPAAKARLWLAVLRALLRADAAGERLPAGLDLYAFSAGVDGDSFARFKGDEPGGNAKETVRIAAPAEVLLPLLDRLLSGQYGAQRRALWPAADMLLHEMLGNKFSKHDCALAVEAMAMREFGQSAKSLRSMLARQAVGAARPEWLRTWTLYLAAPQVRHKRSCRRSRKRLIC